MDTYINQKEILLVVNTHFFTKDWVKRNETEADKRFTQKEKLIDACWNGLVPELLPECFDPSDKTLRLLQVSDSNAFLDLFFCGQVQKNEDAFSVNPYLFMEVQYYN